MPRTIIAGEVVELPEAEEPEAEEPAEPSGEGEGEGEGEETLKDA